MVNCSQASLQADPVLLGAACAAYSGGTQWKLAAHLVAPDSDGLGMAKGDTFGKVLMVLVGE